MEKLRVLSLFSGCGAFEKALENLGIQHEVVGYCEIDKYAAKAYSVLHGVSESMNYGDIKAIDETKLSEFDLMTWGFPCQDISVGNVNNNGLQGSRSGLYYDGLRIISTKLPKYSIIENVDNLASTKYRNTLDQILKDLEILGYTNYYQVMNAVDYGIPQNRNRIFIVSIRNDIGQAFEFPQKQPLETPWWEFINPYDTRELTGRQQRMVNVVKGVNDELIKIEGIPQFDCATIWLRMSGLRFQANKEHPTISAYYGKGGGNFTILAYKGHIGGITPRQCFKLMGFDYKDCDKLERHGISQSHLYAMAGNSIVITVLEGIFKALLCPSVFQCRTREAM